MIANLEKASDVVLPGIRKAAILLVVMGDQVSAEFIRQLGEEEVQLVSREIARLNMITAEHAEIVLEEFYQQTAARDYALKGGSTTPGACW